VGLKSINRRTEIKKLFNQEKKRKATSVSRGRSVKRKEKKKKQTTGKKEKGPKRFY